MPILVKMQTKGDKMNSEELFNKAKKISENSYSPYSNFPVGACCLFENGKIYEGVNVENVSYGLTLCAERNALSTAVSNGEKQGLVKIAIYSPKQKMCIPCGACLQWIAEFKSKNKDVVIILEDLDGKIKEYGLKDFLPHVFAF